jgi:carboxymethylenebutenolidase
MRFGYAEAVREDRVSIDAAGGPMEGYVAAPDGWPPGPAMVVVQEWWGLNDDIMDICRRLAAEGYAAVAPDLYRGKRPAEPDDAQKIAMELDRDKAIEDLMAAVGWLLDECDSVGALGFCMGGSLVWELAVRDDRLLAAVPFYGMADIRGKELVTPVMAHFAGIDRYSPKLLDDLRRELDEQRFAHQMFVYDGAHHGFFNHTGDAYQPEAAALAWDRTIAFLRNEVGGGPA